MNRTAEFRKYLLEASSTAPRKPLRKQAESSTRVDNELNNVTANAFMKDAYAILKHIQLLTRRLALIKRPYLNLDFNEFAALRESDAVMDLTGDESVLASLKYLSNQQRDQVDLQAKTILSRCSEHVRELESVERKRAELAHSGANRLLRLLPARLTNQDVSTVTSEFLAAHHSSVTWYLNRRLAEASQVQKEMQEERIKRQLERTRTLGSVTSTSARPTPSSTPMTAWFNNFTKSGPPPSAAAPEFSDESDEEMELSQSQIQQFEEENSTILKEAESALAAVQQAESRLMDISALQMELVSHLTQQAELTDQLYEDAIAAGSTVAAGNAQLVEARRRQKDSRLYILVFLIGATFTLLFLHNY